MRIFIVFTFFFVATIGCVPENIVFFAPKTVEPSVSVANTKELPPRGESVELSGIPLKIVIAEKTPYYSAPGSQQIGTLPVFQILYIIDTPNRFTSEDEIEWLKVSFTRNAVDAFYVQANWDKNVYLWQHRVEWYPIRTSAVFRQDVYVSFDDVERSIKGEFVSPIGSVALRPERTSENPYPIVDSKRAIAEDGTQYECYKVAFLGRQEEKVYTSNAETKTVGYTQKETQNIIDQLRTIDVLVVLDVTGSMDEHFPTTQDAIREFAEVFKAKNLDVRFQLTTYKDIDEIEIFSWEKIRDFCSRISSLNSEGGGDPEESVYPAMYETLIHTTFRERSERILLLVGDSPSHTRGVNNPKKIGNEEIIRLSNKNNAKVFVAAVSGGQALEKQMREIADATGGMSIALARKSELFEHIRKTLRNTSDDAIDNIIVAKKLSEGKSRSEIENELGKSIAPIVSILRNAKGIDTDKLKAMENGETICTTGWIRCSNNSATAGRLEVFGFKTEFEGTLGVMQTIATLTPEHNTMVSIQVEGFGSRVRTDVPIGKFMDEYGLPHSNPSLLGMTMGEIMLLTEAERASIKETLHFKIRRLNDELNDKLRWRKLSDADERIIGHVSESCLP